MNARRQSFVHLHVHSSYSLLDGMIRLPELVEGALALGYTALALTDHGGVYGLAPFYREALKCGLAPILGAELYLEAPKGESPYHLLLLAEDNVGYHNLLQLVTKGHLKGFHKKPVIKKQWLAAHSQGLIALSGCLQGEIPRLILAAEEGRTTPEEALQAAGEMKEIFGRDRFYLELQYHGLPEEKKVNRRLLSLSRKLSVSYAATNDTHYLKRNQASAHDLLLAIQTLSSLKDTSRLSLKTREYYLKSPQEMARIFSGAPAALANTVRIAERCRVELEFDALRLPEFPVPSGFTPESYLTHLTGEGMKERYPNPSKEVFERRQHELAIINQAGLAGYFLIAWDVVAFAKREGIPVGPGRGSGVGSLVAYLLGITQVDPIRHGLLFERFLNPERIGMPDLDIDLCHWGRPRVLEYLRSRYGQEHVAHLGAFVTLRPRAVIRDVGRALDVAYPKIDRAAKAVPYYADGVEAALAESPRLREMAEDPEIRSVLDYALELEGLPRHMTQHAAGMVITPRPLTNYLALQKAGGEEVITQAEMNTVEELGLLKLDLLGLRYLTVIAETLSFLREDGIFPTEEEIPLDDHQTYQAIAAGETIGTFQLESGGMRRLLRRYQPERMDDLIAILALFRPGPLNSGMVETFIQRRHGKAPVEYLHPVLRPVLEDTYGVLLYQEQVMETARALAGFSLGEADLLRRAVSKRNPAALEEMRGAFLSGATRLGVKPDTATAVFDLIQKFGGYGFAKAHSAAYALTSYRTVYLKTHYPVAYHAALLSLNWGALDRFPRYLSEVRRKGIKLLLPEINRSEVYFRPEEGAIRSGLLCVRDLGEKGLRAILRERKERGDFRSLSDFAERLFGSGLSKKAADNLIRVGAFQSFGASPQLLYLLRSLWGRPHRQKPDPAQGVLFSPLAREEMSRDNQLPEYPEEVRLNLQRELLGHYFTKHPLEVAGVKESGLDLTTAEELAGEEEAAEKAENLGERIFMCGLVEGIRGHRTRKGERMCFAALEDLTGLVDLVYFPQTLKKYGHLLAKRGPFLVWGRPDRTGDQVNLVVEGMRPWSELKGSDLKKRRREEEF